MKLISYDVKRMNLQNSMCRQCESNREFKSNKYTHLTPLFCLIYAII